jgi:hypothetical protein
MQRGKLEFVSIYSISDGHQHLFPYARAHRRR